MARGERPLDERGLPENYPLQEGWEVTPREVAVRRGSGEGMLLLDVREPAEVRAAAIADSVRIPMGEIKSRMADLEEYADDPVVVLCHHGGRSMQVTAFLKQQGFEEVRSMAGGIDLWSRDVDQSIPRY